MVSQGIALKISYILFMLKETKIKGLTTELQCQLFFTQMGYNISVPLGEDCRYDFILDLDGILLRVQVKTCREEKNGIVFSVKSVHLNSTKGTVSHSYTKNDIDVFATFYKEKCYLIPVEECGVSEKKLLFNKNSIMQQGSLLKDYQAEEMIKKLKSIENFSEEQEIKNIPQQITFKKEVIKVKQFTMNKEYLNEYSSYAEASRAIGVKRGGSHISEAASGKRKSAYGFLWEVEINKE